MLEDVRRCGCAFTDSIAREIGLAIVSGRLRPGHVLDGEVEASSRRRVSHTAYREALRILSAKGLIQSRPRTGTRVSRIEDWHLLDPDVLEWLFSDTPSPQVLHGLFELRTIVEPAAAALAAVRREESHLQQMKRALEAMALHTLHRPEGREADKEFHAALLAGSRNPFVASLIQGVTAAVDALTQFKLRLHESRARSGPGPCMRLRSRCGTQCRCRPRCDGQVDPSRRPRHAESAETLTTHQGVALGSFVAIGVRNCKVSHPPWRSRSRTQPGDLLDRGRHGVRKLQVTRAEQAQDGRVIEVAQRVQAHCVQPLERERSPSSKLSETSIGSMSFSSESARMNASRRLAPD